MPFPCQPPESQTCCAGCFQVRDDRLRRIRGDCFKQRLYSRIAHHFILRIEHLLQAVAHQQYRIAGVQRKLMGLVGEIGEGAQRHAF